MTTEVQPRFEFRVWGKDLGGPAGRLRRLSGESQDVRSEETYVIAIERDDVNAKIRDGLLDIKVLSAVSQRCELWRPWLKADFPLAASLLLEEVLPRLGVVELDLHWDSYSLATFIDDVIRSHPQLHVVDLSKRRLKYDIAGCLAEFAEVTVNRHELATLAAESADLDALRELLRRLGIEGFENVSYPLAIKRALGW